MNGVILAILSLHVAGSLIIKFLLKRMYGLEKMLYEKFQDGCLVHGHILLCRHKIIIRRIDI